MWAQMPWARKGKGAVWVRNFDNFVTKYLEYSDNKFAPKSFHLWSALSIIAGALERKVWLPWNATTTHYPNLYVFLVANPGIGKSSALDRAVDLLAGLGTHDGLSPINIIAEQITEAKLIDSMLDSSKSYMDGSKLIQHCSGYYHASEASNAIKEVFGNPIPCFTSFYDCPRTFRKSTKKDGDVLVNNICFNMIAGCTFEFLGKLITDDNIMGGFASRIIYVPFREKMVREVKFQDGLGAVESAEQERMRLALQADLRDIYQMQGAFTAEPAYARAYEKWFLEYEEYRQSNPSEKLQSLLVRRPTIMLKLGMILSASENSDRVLRLHHIDGAQKLIESVESQLPGMLREMKSQQVGSQGGINHAVMRQFDGGQQVTLAKLRAALLMSGHDGQRLAQTVEHMIRNNLLGTVEGPEGPSLKLLVNPDAHL